MKQLCARCGKRPRLHDYTCFCQDCYRLVRVALRARTKEALDIVLAPGPQASVDVSELIADQSGHLSDMMRFQTPLCPPIEDERLRRPDRPPGS